jgi:hypothetical protein
VRQRFIDFLKQSHYATLPMFVSSDQDPANIVELYFNSKLKLSRKSETTPISDTCFTMYSGRLIG